MKFSAYAESEIKFVPQCAKHISHCEAIFHCRRQFHSFQRNEFHLKKPLAKASGFFMAPLVGLEPTTCGLTDHETKSKRAKQSIKNRDRSSVFGDHPATRLRKQPFAKMASSPVAVPILPNSPGRFLPAGIRTGKIQSTNHQGKE